MIAQTDDAAAVDAALPDWKRERAIVHTLPQGRALPSGPGLADVRLLGRSDSGRCGHLPSGLRHEIIHAVDLAPVGAVFVGNVPVPFCYPCWQIEPWWDVSVDTLEEYRGRQLAFSAFRFMYDHMRGGRRAPVWGALESNAVTSPRGNDRIRAGRRYRGLLEGTLGVSQRRLRRDTNVTPA